MFYNIHLVDEETFKRIKSIKGKDWSYSFAEEVYKNVENNKYFITNLGKCTQIDARPLPDKVYLKYLELFYKEIEIINPKVVILFGNQVSSIVLDEKISVSLSRKKVYNKKINGKEYKFFPVFYPVGNGRFNINKSIEDIKWIIDNYVR